MPDREDAINLEERSDDVRIGKKSVHVAMVQPKDGVERSIVDNSHVAITSSQTVDLGRRS